MKQFEWQKHIAVILFLLTLLLFFGFFAYTTTERVALYHADQVHDYRVLTDLKQEVVTDPSAPAGLRKIYRGILDPEQSLESCLCFNIPPIRSRCIWTTRWSTASRSAKTTALPIMSAATGARFPSDPPTRDNW